MAQFPNTMERVPSHTTERANQRIEQALKNRLLHFANHPADIDERLEELEQEWDIERKLETNASLLALAGTVLGATVHRRFLLVPAFVTGFLAQHALQGWCPPLPIFRRLGTRTAREIEKERYALKYLRGDFQNLPDGDSPKRHVEAVLKAIEQGESVKDKDNSVT